jgi:hypothetical protein
MTLQAIQGAHAVRGMDLVLLGPDASGRVYLGAVYTSHCQVRSGALTAALLPTGYVLLNKRCCDGGLHMSLQTGCFALNLAASNGIHVIEWGRANRAVCDVQGGSLGCPLCTTYITPASPDMGSPVARSRHDRGGGHDSGCRRRGRAWGWRR